MTKEQMDGMVETVMLCLRDVQCADNEYLGEDPPRYITREEVRAIVRARLHQVAEMVP